MSINAKLDKQYSAPLITGTHTGDAVVIPVAEEVDPDTGDVILFRGSFESKKLHGYFMLGFYLTCLMLLPLYGVGLILFLFTPLFYVKQRRRVSSMEMYVTSRAVVFKQTAYSMGCCLAKTTEKHVMLDNITDVSYDQSFLQRMRGVATIKVENPGQSGTGKDASGSDLAVTGLGNPHLVKRVLLQLRHRVRYGMALDVPTVRAIVNGDVFNTTGALGGGIIDPAASGIGQANMAPVRRSHFFLQNTF